MVILLVFGGLLVSIILNGLADNLPVADRRPFPLSFFPACAYCGSVRKARDLLAVGSTLFQAGRCLRCSAPRPFRDLLVEAILMISFPALWLFGKTSVPEILLSGFILSVFLLFLIIDFEHRYVLGEVVGLVSLILLLCGLLRGFSSLVWMVEGGAGGLLIFLLLYLLGWLMGKVFHIGHGIEPLGFGDVILAALVGIVTGWPAVLMAVFLSIFIAGIAGVILFFLSAVRRVPLGTATMAYGPYLLISGLIVYFFGGPLVEWIANSIAIL
jgi:prepilin signal peptidase PulO-like enzyme (type II secretory pathway)